MDVERIQKINQLASSLLTQGLAQDRDDAVKQAEKVFRSQDTESYTEMRETMQKVQAEKSPQPQQNELTQDQIQTILKKNTEYLVKTIKAFQEKVQTLEQEMAAMKNQMSVNKIPSVKELVMSAPKVEQEQQIQAQQTPQETPKEAPIHPRSGNYKEADVSVEKFFYMGSK
ncbi:hypothetical protein HOI26_05715 [Candidatus Woesearchaeota archaeon]|jgi:hypothetical protein|nr:hypothetical protein [Candidatus Woesearchaeota archaeon]MBT5740564.1 hypothetical protein [Candidatus Woesearchaeota archaeon]